MYNFPADIDYEMESRRILVMWAPLIGSAAVGSHFYQLQTVESLSSPST